MCQKLRFSAAEGFTYLIGKVAGCLTSTHGLRSRPFVFDLGLCEASHDHRVLKCRGSFVVMHAICNVVLRGHFG